MWFRCSKLCGPVPVVGATLARNAAQFLKARSMTKSIRTPSEHNLFAGLLFASSQESIYEVFTMLKQEANEQTKL